MNKFAVACAAAALMGLAACGEKPAAEANNATNVAVENVANAVDNAANAVDNAANATNAVANASNAAH